MAKAENTVIFDGIKYNPGDELPDLGSWVCTDARGMVRDYEGLSKDVSKLPHYVESGSSALCLDTSELYEYHKPTDTWYGPHKYFVFRELLPQRSKGPQEKTKNHGQHR